MIPGTIVMLNKQLSILNIIFDIWHKGQILFISISSQNYFYFIYKSVTTKLVCALILKISDFSVFSKLTTTEQYLKIILTATTFNNVMHSSNSVSLIQFQCSQNLCCSELVTYKMSKW